MFRTSHDKNKLKSIKVLSMEESQITKNTIKRAKKKKATVNETSKIKNIPLTQSNHKRSNSESIKKVPNKSTLESASVLKLITKGPSINKLFFKNDNISLKSESMPKANKKQVKKFRSINICKEKTELLRKNAAILMARYAKAAPENEEYLRALHGMDVLVSVSSHLKI